MFSPYLSFIFDPPDTADAAAAAAASVSLGNSTGSLESEEAYA